MNVSRAKPLRTTASGVSRSTGPGKRGRADAHSLSLGRRPQVPRARPPTVPSVVGIEERVVSADAISEVRALGVVNWGQ